MLGSKTDDTANTKSPKSSQRTCLSILFVCSRVKASWAISDHSKCIFVMVKADCDDSSRPGKLHCTRIYLFIIYTTKHTALTDCLLPTRRRTIAGFRLLLIFIAVANLCYAMWWALPLARCVLLCEYPCTLRVFHGSKAESEDASKEGVNRSPS